MSRLPRNPDPSGAQAYFASKVAYTTGPVELDQLRREGASILIVDVRGADDFAAGHIPGAVHLPRERWMDPPDLEPERTLVLYSHSQVCRMAASAALELATHGFSVMELEGGFAAWREHGLDVEKIPADGGS